MDKNEYQAEIIRINNLIEFNEKIHCPRVANKWRRERDKLVNLYGNKYGSE